MLLLLLIPLLLFFDVVIVAAVVWLLFELYNHFTLYFFGLIFALHSVHYFIACIEEFTRRFFFMKHLFRWAIFSWYFVRIDFFSSFWILSQLFVFFFCLSLHACTNQTVQPHIISTLLGNLVFDSLGKFQKSRKKVSECIVSEWIVWQRIFRKNHALDAT